MRQCSDRKTEKDGVLVLLEGGPLLVERGDKHEDVVEGLDIRVELLNRRRNWDCTALCQTNISKGILNRLRNWVDGIRDPALEL